MEDDQNLDQASGGSEGTEVQPDQSESVNESESGSMAKADDPLAVKKRLGQQAKRHQREMRAMQDQLAQMQSQMGQTPQSQNNPQSNMMQPQSSPQGMSIEEQIQRGVQFALHAKEQQEAQAKEAQRLAHVQKQYQLMNDKFDQASDKYDDFDDVVRGHDAPFSPAVRDALLMVDNPADVAYKLGKNRDELQRISQLHPLDQAREVNKLSFALMNGNKANSAPGNNPGRPMSNLKANPVNNSQAITNNTPSSVIRARMKAGTWK